MTPRVARWVAFAAGLAAVISAVILQPPGRPPSVLDIRYVISTDAAELIGPLIKDFNGLDEEVNGRQVRVTWTVAPSGIAVNGIRDRNLKPVAWTPGSSLWAGLLNAKASTTFVRELGPSLVQSPQVVAIFETTANTLRLSSSERLQRVLEKAAAGDLKLGHTDPNVSTSGLSAALSEFYLASGKDAETLTPEDVHDPDVRERVRRWEGSIAHYVDIGKDFKDLWCMYGPPFADAAYMQETTFLEFNRTCQTQLVAIYPTDVPLVADYPYIVLDAPWVTPQQGAAARMLGRWLEGQLSVRCAAVAASGFRREGCKPPSASLPELPAPPVRLPDRRVLPQVQAAWSELRRPAHVTLVVDATNAMASLGRLASAKEALLRFTECARKQDHVGMIVFGRDGKNPVDDRLPLAPYAAAHQRQRLLEEIEQLAAGRGPPALADAIERAFSTPGMLDPGAINTVIVLSFSDVDKALADDVIRLPIQILAVPYRNPVALAPLMDLVTASLGRIYDEMATAAYGDDASHADALDVGKFLCQFL